MVASRSASRGQVTNSPSSCLSKVQQPEIAGCQTRRLLRNFRSSLSRGEKMIHPQLGALSKQKTGNRHHFATRSGAQASHHQ